MILFTKAKLSCAGKFRYKMLVNKVFLVMVLMLSFQLLQITIAGRDNSDNYTSSSTSITVRIPALPESHVRSGLEENYGDLPLKFLCKHKKLVRQLIILQKLGRYCLCTGWTVCELQFE